MLLNSKPYARDFEVGICPKAECETFEIISHKSLQDIHDIEMRGRFNTEVSVVKDNANHALVKCVMIDNETDFRVEEIGEKLKTSVDTEIGKTFPVTSAATRAFDRAMIRMLGFEGKFYSDAEIDKAPDSVHKEEKKEEILPETFSEESVDLPPEAEYLSEPDIVNDVAEDVVLDDDLSYVPEVIEEPASNAEDPGNYILNFGKRKGQSLNDVYADKDGKSWLDFCLGGQYVKQEAKDAIVAFYAHHNLKVDDGEATFVEAAKKYYDANIERFKK